MSCLGFNGVIPHDDQYRAASETHTKAVDESQLKSLRYAPSSPAIIEFRTGLAILKKQKLDGKDSLELHNLVISTAKKLEQEQQQT